MPNDIACVKLLKMKNKLTGDSILADDDFIFKLCVLTGVQTISEQTTKVRSVFRNPEIK